MSNKLILPLLIISISWLACCNTGEQPPGKKPHPTQSKETKDLKGEIRISGAYALSPLIGSCAMDFNQIHPEVTIIVVPRGSELGLDDLHRQKTDIAMVSSLRRPKPDDGWSVAVARTSVALIYNKRNPVRETIQERGIMITDLQRIYSAGRISYWNEALRSGDSVELHPYARGDLAGSTHVLADFLFLDKNELIGIPVNGEDDMISIVQRDSLALGYCNITAAFDMSTYQKQKDIELLPVDLNQNGMLEPREELCSDLFDFSRETCLDAYPHRLTRNLYLVTDNPPRDEVVLEFIRFVMNEGRRFADSLGYQPIPAELQAYENYRVKNIR